MAWLRAKVRGRGSQEGDVILSLCKKRGNSRLGLLGWRETKSPESSFRSQKPKANRDSKGEIHSKNWPIASEGIEMARLLHVVLGLTALLFVTIRVDGAEPARMAVVLLNDGTGFRGALLGITDGQLHLQCDDSERTVRLTDVRSLVFDASEGPAIAEPAPPPMLKIGLIQIEIRDSVSKAQQRLDRIGADYTLIPPDAAPDRLAEFDVLYIPYGWASLAGLSSLAKTYRDYVSHGGGLLLSGPSTDRGWSEAATLKLLPYEAKVGPGLSGSRSVVARQTGNSHVLMSGVDTSDLPYPYVTFDKLDSAWTVLSMADRSEAPTMLSAMLGRGRVLVHSDFDNYSVRHFLSDRFFVRILRWCAARPDAEVRRFDAGFGPPRRPEWFRQLEQDYARLIVDEPATVQKAVRKAERLLKEDAQQSSTWTAYREADSLLTQHRSKATIPMLLALLADDRYEHDSYRALMLTRLFFLTGRTLPEGKVDIERIATQWWLPHRDVIETNPGMMAEPQRNAIVQAILEAEAKVLPQPFGEHGRADFPTAKELQSVIDHSVPSGWSRHDLNAALLPDFIRAASDAKTCWHALLPLALCARDGHGKAIEKAVKDPTSSPRLRVIGAISLWKGGYRMPVNLLAQILERTEDAGLRAAALIVLGRSDHPAAQEIVSSYRSDGSPLVRQAANLSNP